MITRNVISNWSGLAANMAVAFLMSPFLVHRLGDTMYGLWALLLAVTGYMGLLDAGLRVSVVKYVSRFSASSDVASLSRVISTALGLCGGISLLVVVAGLAAAPMLPGPFSIPPETLGTAKAVLVICAVNVALMLLLSILNGTLGGRQRYDRMNAIAIVVLVFRTALIVALVAGGYGIVALGLAHTVAQVGASALLVRAVRREIPGLRMSWRHVDVATVRMLYGYGIFVLLNNVAMFLLFNTAEIIVGVFAGAAAVTYYAIAGSLLQHLSRLINVMAQVLHPYASAQDARGDRAALRRTVVLGTKACVLIALPACLTIIVLGRRFLAAWMGASYADVAAPLLVILAVGQLFWLSQSTTGNVLLGVGRHKLWAVLNLATGATSVTMGAVLIQAAGLPGLAVGMSAPIAVVNGIVLPLIATRVFGVGLADYAREAYWQPLAATVPYLAVLVGLVALAQPTGLLALAGVVILAAPAFVVPASFICFTADERRALLASRPSWIPLPVPIKR